MHACVAIGRRHESCRAGVHFHEVAVGEPSRRIDAVRSGAPPQVMRVTGVWQFVQPAVVSVAAVGQREVRIQLQFDAVFRYGRCRTREQAQRRGIECARFPAVPAAGCHAPVRSTSFQAASNVADPASAPDREPRPRAGRCHATLVLGSRSAVLAAGAGVCFVTSGHRCHRRGIASCSRPVEQHVQQSARVRQRLNDWLLNGCATTQAALRHSSTSNG